MSSNVHFSSSGQLWRKQISLVTGDSGVAPAPRARGGDFLINSHLLIRYVAQGRCASGSPAAFRRHSLAASSACSSFASFWLWSRCKYVAAASRCLSRGLGSLTDPVAMATQTPKFPPATLPQMGSPAPIAAAYPRNTNTPPGSGAPVVSAREILMDLVFLCKL